jgi:DNA adenine methylase
MVSRAAVEAGAAPFLKWAGGKGQLLDRLAALAPRKIANYHEPFVGSGALYFHLRSKGRITGSAHLSDVNPALIGAYDAVRNDLTGLIEHLRTLDAAHDRANPQDAYYRFRERYNELRDQNGTERAALLLYLNRTGFNGLYRENASGGFNVPVGSYKNPTILDEPRLRAANRALRLATVRNEPFEAVLRRAQPGDFVYFDPPYQPLSATSSFRAYAKDGFDEPEQRRLSEVFAELTRRGVLCMLSNSTAPLILELYGALVDENPSVRFLTVTARRAINSKAERRGTVDEALVVNFSP